MSMSVTCDGGGDFDRHRKGNRGEWKSLLDLNLAGLMNFEESKQLTIWESDQSSASTDKSSHDNLASLYRPPFALVYNGPFYKAKVEACLQAKWLLVNLQSIEEFSSHMLNRDTWSNDVLAQTIRTSFIFWQVYHDSIEGRKVLTYYNMASKLPAILVIDPFTGQKICAWTGMIPAERLLENLLLFTDRGLKEQHVPPHKCPRESVEKSTVKMPDSQDRTANPNPQNSSSRQSTTSSNASMTLSLRQKQTDCIVRMLNFNQPSNSATLAGTGEFSKILILDRFCLDILSPLIHVKDLKKHGITLHFLIDKDRQPIPAVPAVYFVQPSPVNVAHIIADAAQGLYDSFHFNFSSPIPRPVLETLVEGTVRSEQRISKVCDQYLEFVTLDHSLFSLAHRDAYLQLNDPATGDREIEAIVDRIVRGLFCALATLGAVPVIRCAKGGPAEMVASALDSRLRDHLLAKNNIFSEGCLVNSSFRRPVLCIFDRNFELAAMVQHNMNYRPLVHDLLGMKLNRVVEMGAAKSSYELDNSDLFWTLRSWSPLRYVSKAIGVQLRNYEHDVYMVNRRTGGPDGAEFDGTDLNAVNSLTEHKKMIDKHRNISTALIVEIGERSLGAYSLIEKNMLVKGSVDWNYFLEILGGKGTEVDKLRLAITYILSMETTPQSEFESIIETVLRESGVDTCAFHYVKKIMSLKASSLASSSLDSKNNTVDWVEKLYGQSISALKNHFSDKRRPALTRAVEALMEGNPDPEVDSYLVFDPCAPRSGSGAQLRGPFEEGIVFMIGGGNYVEYMNLMSLEKCLGPRKHVVYGTTEILNGVEFVEQLRLLGQKMGFGSSSVDPSP